MRLAILCLLLLSLTHSSRVDTLLFAPWTSSTRSSLLEAAEFFSYYGEDDYKAFVTSLVVENKELEDVNDMELWIMDFCQTRYSSDVCSLLKLSQKSREMLPKVAMFQNIATRFASLCPDSDTFLLTSTYYSCSVEMIKLQQPYPDDFVLDESQRSDLLSRKEFDHAIHLSPPSLSDIPPVVLFSSYKKDLHTWLSALNADSIPSILLRPFHSQSTHPSEHTQLGGYGIALDIKNTEYKVVDDRSATGVRMAENEVEAELETEFQGFHFATLKSRYPDLVPSLQAFKESLQEEMSQTTAESISPLQLKDLGVKSVQRIVHSQDPLKQFQEIACDLPSLAVSIARVPITDTFKNEAAKLSEEWKGARDQVIMNGQAVSLDDTSFNLFELQRSLRQSIAFHQQCHAAGLNSAAIQTISRLVGEFNDENQGDGASKPIRLAESVLDHPSILYLNDIQRDPRYSQFSGSVRRFLMPMFQLPMIRANYLSRVMIIDPMEVDLALVQTVYEMLQQGYPVQFGVVFFSKTAITELQQPLSTVKGKDPLSPGQLLLLCASFKKETALAALAFLNNFRMGNDHSVRAALALYENLLEEDAMEVLEDDHIRRHVLQTAEWVQSLGLESGMELLNGRVMMVQSMDSFFQKASDEISTIVSGVAEGEIRRISEIRPFLYKQSRVFEMYLPQLSETFANQRYMVIPEEVGVEKNLQAFTDGSDGVVMIAIASIDQLVATLPLLSSELQHYSVFLTSSPAFTGLLSFAKAMQKAQLLDSAVEVLLCLKNQNKEKERIVRVSEIQHCLEVYVEEDEMSEIGMDWQQDEVFAEWNAKAWELLMKEGKGASETEQLIVVNSRVLKLPSLSPSILRIVVESDQMISKPLREAFPTHSLITLLPFIHQHRNDFYQRSFSFPESSSLLLRNASSSSSSSSSTQSNDVLFIQAVVDPLSAVAQRLSALLIALRSIIPIHYEILLLPGHDYSSLPLKRYYRYVANDQELAVWHNLPQHYVYTMSVEVPYKWNVVAYYAESDLDNLRVMDDYTYILAQYVVDGVIIEGSCYNTEGKPASGVMLELRDFSSATIRSDTVVMNKGGYWQLRGDMGSYEVVVSADSPGKSLLGENGDTVEKVTIYNWNNLDYTVELSLKQTSASESEGGNEHEKKNMKKKKKAKNSFVDKIKTSLFSRSSTPSSIGDSISQMVEESEEEEYAI